MSTNTQPAADAGRPERLPWDDFDACNAALGAFAAAVNAHVQLIPADVWARYQKRAQASSPVPPDPPLSVDAPREKIAFVSVSVHARSLRAILDFAPGSFVEVATVVGQPVHFAEVAGIFVWAPSPDSVQCLRSWLTFPAYHSGPTVS